MYESLRKGNSHHSHVQRECLQLPHHGHIWSQNCRSETSLQSYNSRPSTSQLRSCSDILTNYTSGSESTSVNPMQPLMSVSAYPGSTVPNCGNITESSSTFQRRFTGMFNGCSIGNLNVVINNN